MTSLRKIWGKLGPWFESGFSVLLRFFVGAYRTLGTAHFGGACRFEPSCSEYAMEALRRHRPLSASKLIGARILRCRPGGAFGYDPVPHSTERSFT